MEWIVLLNLLGVSEMKTKYIFDHQMHCSTAVSYLDNNVEEKKLYIQYWITNLANGM